MQPTNGVLLLGGTGKVGREIAKLLAGTSVPTSQSSRKGDVTTEPDADNIHPVAFTWSSQASWCNALHSKPHSVYIVAPPITDMLPPMRAFIDLARAKGVKRFVLLSASSLEPGPESAAMGLVHWYLKELGDRGEVEWAALRPTWFQQNFADQEAHVTSIREENAIYSATGDGKLPWVSATDIAACAYRLLTQEEAPNDEFVILGPELLSYKDIANILSDVLARRIVHHDLSAEGLEERFMSHGSPEDYAKMMGAMDTAIKNGSENRTNDVVLKLTGKQPTRFRDTAEKNRGKWTTHE